jgi:aspartyl-tRNA(Asn)/glutamyl-tRNA(Gln) amidotransferase subunit C
MLTDKEVRHIAGLARIKISEKEEKGLKKDLSSILEYIDKLNEVDTTGVEPLYQTTGLVNSFRSDEPRGEFKPAPHQSRPISDWRSAEKIGAGMDDLLIGQAPHKEDRFVKVKSILSHK